MKQRENELNISFKRLTPELCDDFLYYFDNIAFTDHEEWSACYCLESHLGDENDAIWDNRQARREKAGQLIRQGIMQGYLVYDNDKIIGWCNAGDKKSYAPVISSGEHETEDLSRSRVKVIYCLEIAPAYRGMGISHRIVERVCEDAKNDGFDYVEAYPFLDRSFEYQYHGPVHLYESHGFERLADKSDFCIMSKRL